jgi:hypothetical protein
MACRGLYLVCDNSAKKLVLLANFTKKIESNSCSDKFLVTKVTFNKNRSQTHLNEMHGAAPFTLLSVIRIDLYVLLYYL